MISGKTRLVAIIGTPVAQVKSPDNFNAHFRERSEDTAMIAMDIKSEGVSDFVSLVRCWNNLDGFVVTVPHKQAIAACVDEVSERAAALGAVNVVRREPDGRLIGDMVDGHGFLDAARMKGFIPSGKNILVVGAGGAGSAIAHAMCEAGASSLSLLDTDVARAETLASLLQEAFPKAETSVGYPDLGSIDLLVNATPMGMKPDDPLPVDAMLLNMLDRATLVADVVTSPEMTPFLREASARGCVIQTGPEMAKAQMELLGRFMGVMTAPATAD
ncbi:MAG: shikimate dehydrogenase family protein [Phyllobacterium sp.]